MALGPALGKSRRRMPESVPEIYRPESEHVVPRRRREATSLAAIAGGELLSTVRQGNKLLEADPPKAIRDHAPRETDLVRRAALGIDLKRLAVAKADLAKTLEVVAAAPPADVEEIPHVDELEIMATQALAEDGMPESLRPHGIDRRVLKEFFTAGTSGSSHTGAAAAQCFYSGGNRPYAGAMAVHRPSKTTAYGRRLK